LALLFFSPGFVRWRNCVDNDAPPIANSSFYWFNTILGSVYRFQMLLKPYRNFIPQTTVRVEILRKTNLNIRSILLTGRFFKMIAWLGGAKVEYFIRPVLKTERNGNIFPSQIGLFLKHVWNCGEEGVALVRLRLQYFRFRFFLPRCLWLKVIIFG